MKKKIKRYIYLLIIFSLLIFYYFGTKIISNNEYNFIFHLKTYIPNSLKHHLKNTIFIIPKLKKDLEILKEKNKILKTNLKRNKKLLKN